MAATFEIVASNVPKDKIPTSLTPRFSIAAPPGCDLWRSPPSHIVSTAPLVGTHIDVSTFKSARITVSLTLDKLYDQAGLALVLEEEHWIKAGVELNGGVPYVSCVVARPWSDWSLTPLNGSTDGLQGTSTEFTIEIERLFTNEGSARSALWVYLVQKDGTRHPLREVTSFFKDASSRLHVAAYAACPAKDRPEALVAHFSEFKLIQV